MEQVTIALLERLIAPFLGHEGLLYFTRYAERVYVGKTPAQKYAESIEAPTNYSLAPSQVDATSLAVMAARLNQLEEDRVRSKDPAT